MAIFITGSTGYLGSYAVERLLRRHPDRLALLVRAKNENEAKRKLWKSLQLHMPFAEFRGYLDTRIDIYLGDLALRDLGIHGGLREKLVDDVDSVLHIAASLNRKSDKACFNHNLRGTLHVINLAREAHRRHGLRRFSEVSTAAVAGERSDELVLENDMIDWERSDYDPYARTKKFGEYMVHELLPDVKKTIFRPSIVLGDSRFPQTTQFDMVRAFVHLASLPVLPFDREWRADIVPADFVGASLVDIHQKDDAKFESYNLSAGSDSLTFGRIVEALASHGGRKPPVFAPLLEKPVGAMVDVLANSPRALGAARLFSLLKVFWPYLTFNTVFDNSRVVEELGAKPAPFHRYAHGLRAFAKNGGFAYPYQPWPEEGA